jgi:hypothetical protein
MPRILLAASALGSAGLALLGLSVVRKARQGRAGAASHVSAITIRRDQDDVERSLQETGLSHRVRLSAAPGGRGTEVRVIDGDSDSEPVDLRRLKQLLETGEVAISDATVERRDLLQRHAQPMRAHA